MRRLLPVLALLALGLAAPASASALACTGSDLDVTAGVVNGLTGSPSCTTLTIPASVSGTPITGIGSSAFYGLTSLTSVTLPSGLQTIGNNAFSGDTALTSIAIPGTVTTIGNGAFDHDSSLASVTFPGVSQLTSIGTYAFAWTAITSFAMPNSVTTLGLGAFRQAANLTTLTLSSALTSIPVDAFYEDGALTGSLTIPAGVTTIGNNSFRYTGLTSLTLNANLRTIGNGAFDHTPITGALVVPPSVQTVGYGSFDSTSITSLTLAEGLQTIGNVAFHITTLQGTVTLPSTVQSIGDDAFADSRITSITLNSGLLSIGNGAFSSNPALTGVLRIPASVSSIGSAIVSSDSSLAGVTFLGDRPSTFSATAFNGSDGPFTFSTGTSDWGDGGLCGDVVSLGNGSVTGVCTPAITGVSPSLLSAAGGPVTISGSGFMAGATVTIGGKAATGVTVVSPTTITATAPIGSAGAAAVEVTNLGVRSGTRADAAMLTTYDPVPSGVAAKPGNRSAAVTWTSGGGSAISSFTATASPGGATCTSATTSCTIKGLDNGTAYRVTVTATSTAWTSAASAASTPVTPRTEPAAVRGLALGAVTRTSATVKWKAPARTGGAKVSGYQARLQTGRKWGRWIRVKAGALTRTWTGLDPGQRYAVQVRAGNDAGFGKAQQVVVPARR